MWIFSVIIALVVCTFTPSSVSAEPILTGDIRQLLCPISRHIMVDPVKMSDGHVYDRSSVWELAKSPITGEHFYGIPVPSVDVQSQIEGYITRLWAAIDGDNVQDIKQLLTKTAQVPLESLYYPGKAPMLFSRAAHHGSTKVLAAFMQRLRIEAQTSATNAAASKHSHNRMKSEAMLHVVKANKPEAIGVAMAGGAPSDYQSHNGGKTYLMAASNAGHSDLVDSLLQYGSAQTINARDTNGQSALLMAAKHNHANVVKSLLKARADPSLCDYDGTCAASILQPNMPRRSLDNTQERTSSSTGGESHVTNQSSINAQSGADSDPRTAAPTGYVVPPAWGRRRWPHLFRPSRYLFY